MRPRSGRPSPYAEAGAWLGRIVAMALVMIAPIVLGQKMDAWLNTSFIALLGIVVGLVVGFVYLLAITGVLRRPKRPNQTNHGTPPERSDDP